MGVIGLNNLYSDLALIRLLKKQGLDGLGMWYMVASYMIEFHSGAISYHHTTFKKIAEKAGIENLEVKLFLNVFIKIGLLTRVRNKLYITERKERNRSREERWKEKEEVAKATAAPKTPTKTPVKKLTKAEQRKELYSKFPFLEDKEIQILWKDFREMRSDKKRPLTLLAEERRLMELRSHSSGKREVIVYLLKRTTDAGWDQFYSLTTEELKQFTRRSNPVHQYLSINKK